MYKHREIEENFRHALFKFDWALNESFRYTSMMSQKTNDAHLYMQLYNFGTCSNWRNPWQLISSENYSHDTDLFHMKYV